MRRYALSPFPYYGGKSRMADLIADIIDYQNTTMYIEPFGGACRILLNKMPHQSELYCDASRGLCTFFEIVQKEETCLKLQEELLETEISVIEFWECLKYKARVEQSILKDVAEALKKYVSKMKRNSSNPNVIDIARRLRQEISELKIEKIIEDTRNLKEWAGTEEQACLEALLEPYETFWEAGEELYWEKYMEGLKRAADEKIEGRETKSQKAARLETEGRRTAFSALANMEEPPELGLEDEIQLAKATFITFYFSRDGMGLSYSEERAGNRRAFYKKIDELEEIGRRMRNVRIVNMDAWFFLTQQIHAEDSYIMNPNVMMYLDPSYLSVEDKESGKKGGKNLGNSYHTSYDYKQHKELVENIRDAKAKIIVSNYDVEPYKNTLTEEYGWHRYEFETKTSVGGAKDNKRTEVLWYNY